MGLLIFTGAKLDHGLVQRPAPSPGEKLLPFPLKKGLVDGEIRGLFIEPVRPSPIEKLLDLRPSAFKRVVARQIMGVSEEASRAKRVLARWNDPGRSPAVIERIVGDGRVLLWTSTADRAGNDWPIEPSFVLAIREAIRGTARPTSWRTLWWPAIAPTESRPLKSASGKCEPDSPEHGEPQALAAVPLASQNAKGMNLGRRWRSTCPTRGGRDSTG